MLELALGSGSEADRAGFASLRVAVDVVRGMPVEAWRILGGWMVRAWVEGAGQPAVGRPTVDVDLGLLPPRAPPLARRIPSRLAAAGLKPGKEPFRFVGPGGVLLDLLVPPGASRRVPPRLANQEVFEAPGARFAFELSPEPVKATLDRGTELTFQTARLAAALVLKLAILAAHRPRYLDDARDVASLQEIGARGALTAVADARALLRQLGTGARGS